MFDFLRVGEHMRDLIGDGFDVGRVVFALYNGFEILVFLLYSPSNLHQMESFLVIFCTLLDFNLPTLSRAVTMQILYQQSATSTVGIVTWLSGSMNASKMKLHSFLLGQLCHKNLLKHET